MSRLHKGNFFIEHTKPAKCELCGKIAELRPYGPNEENICVECGQKNKITTERMMGKIMNKSKKIIINVNNTSN